MSKITEAFQNFRTLVGEALPDYRQLHDPYNLDENPEQLLRAGWGIQLDGGNPANRTLSCPDYGIRRAMTVVIVHEAVAKDSDPVRRQDEELEIFEALHLVIQATRNDTNLGNAAFVLEYTGDTGRQEIFIENKPYYYTEASFDVEYHQRATA
jgi:hypothetical protein